MNSIKFYKGEENGLVVETDNMVESIFVEQYIQAFKQIDKLLCIETADIPNVITFCGDRGEGKTSCMTSVQRILKSDNCGEILSSVNVDENTTLGNLCTNLLSTKFCFIDEVIDPAFFDSEHNLLQLLLGQMFSKYKECYRKSNNIDENNARLLTNAFERAKRCLTQIKQPRERIYDPIEELSALSAAQELKDSMDNLFECYIRFFEGPQENKRSMLVICVDDIDLNIEGAYEMVEQIRKYLSSKHCLLLVSLNVDQLIDVIANYLGRKVAVGEKMDVEGMASKYVTKLLPMENRVNMPKVYDLCDRNLEIYASHGGTIVSSYKSVKEAVVELIFFKTRYLFYNSKGGVSPIIPNNLRSLRHLMGLLTNMPDYINNEQSAANKHVFKSYFYQTWIRQLTYEDQVFAGLLVNENDLTSINKSVVVYLAKYIDKEKANNTENQILDIINSSNYSYNVSVGDVFAIINYLERSNVQNEIRLLLFFIKSFYSIKLYELYDVITETAGELYPENDTSNGEIYRADSWFKRTNILQRFINGSYFTYLPDDFLPKTDGGKFTRDIRLYNARLLRREIAIDLKTDMHAFELGTMDEEKISEFKKKFRMTEFFALTSKRSIAQRRADSFDRVKRDVAEPQHLTDFNMNTGYIVFDVMAPFTNVVNLKYAYNRFSYLRSTSTTPDVDFYQFALSQKWSLLRRMIDYVRLKELNDNKPKEEQIKMEKLPDLSPNDVEQCLLRLISNASIRNGEVLSAITEAIVSRRVNMHNVRDNRIVLSQFYADIINTQMSTYHRGNAGEPYIIRFEFLRAIIELLKEDGIEKLVSVYESGLETQKTSNEDVYNHFRQFFASQFKTKKRAAIISDLQKYSGDSLQTLSDSDWFEMFPDENKSYPREYIVSVLRENFVRLTGLVKSTEYYDDDQDLK